MQLDQKSRTVVGSLFLGTLAFLLLWIASPASTRFKVLDPAFKIVDVRFSLGKTHSVYCGGWQGRIRQKLHKVGIPITRFGGLEVNHGEDTLALAVCYGGSLTAAEAQSIEAVIIAAGGDATVLPSQAEYFNSTRKEYARVWSLEPLAPKGAVLQLRTATNHPLAELIIQ